MVDIAAAEIDQVISHQSSHITANNLANNLVYFSGGSVDQVAGREAERINSSFQNDGKRRGNRDSMKGICTFDERNSYKNEDASWTLVNVVAIRRNM